MNAITAFALLSLVLTVTPGPDSLLVLRSSLQAGRRAGIRVAAGAISGSLFWGICSAAGLTAVMAASAQAFRAVQLAGAAYLAFQGIRGWRAAKSPSDGSPSDGHERPGRGPEPGFRTGLLSNVLNPKVGLFFLTVMPQLIPHHAHIAAYALAFAVTDVLIAGTWLTTVAWISDKARALLRRPRTRTALDRAAGATLFALGVKVAAGQLA